MERFLVSELRPFYRAHFFRKIPLFLINPSQEDLHTPVILAKWSDLIYTQIRSTVNEKYDQIGNANIAEIVAEIHMLFQQILSLRERANQKMVKKQLSPPAKGRALGLIEAGIQVQEVARRLGVSRSTISRLKL